MRLGLLHLCYLFIFCLAIQSVDINHIRTKLLVRDTVDDNPDEKEGQPEGADDGDDNGKAKVSSYTFRGKIKKYIYMKKPIDSDATDETLLALTSQNEVFVTHDQGSTWEEVAPDDEFLAIHLNPFDTNDVYLQSTNDKIVYSRDRADNWKSFRTPCSPIPGVSPLVFHPTRKSYLIWIGQTGCDNQYSKACRTAAFISRSYGKRWRKLQENVAKCEFANQLGRHVDPNLVLCLKQSNEATKHRSNLVSSTSDFLDETKILLRQVIDFVSKDGFLVAATANEQDKLQLHVSKDGLTWRDALFPENLRVNKQQAYTILSGKSGSLFVHVTMNPRQGTEFGNLIKSNEAGQSYIATLDAVNRDSNGYVDFEQMEGLEGVIVVNRVVNPRKAIQGSKKQLQTMITHNDGSRWSLLSPPLVDSKGQKYECLGKPLDQCSLHLHGYTDREDPRDTLSSGSAVGMMIGVGNVGSRLENYYDGNTFLTKDGGITWKEIKKGVFMSEYGDQGSIIVLVNGKDSTNKIFYSTDQGDTWTTLQFADKKVMVQDISTVPSDNSLRFLLFTRLSLSLGDKTRIYQIDFSQLLSRQCKLDLENPETDDFELWTPKHPFQKDNCLFGHKTQYYRKLPGKLCHVGKKLVQPYKVLKNCECTREDFECDFNYSRDKDGVCKLVPGYDPPNHEEICFSDNPPSEFYLPTGYRKITLSTCVGGNDYSKASDPIPCKGKKAEFAQRYSRRRSFGTWLSLIFAGIIFTIAVLVSFRVYHRKYGVIRLEDGGNMTMVDDETGILDRFRREPTRTLSEILVLGRDALTNITSKTRQLIDEFKQRRQLSSQPNAYVVTDEDILEDEISPDNSFFDDNEEAEEDVRDLRQEN